MRYTIVVFSSKISDVVNSNPAGDMLTSVAHMLIIDQVKENKMIPFRVFLL